MPPPSSVASVRAACDVENFCAIDPSAGILQDQTIEPPPLAGLFHPPPDPEGQRRDRRRR